MKKLNYIFTCIFAFSTILAFGQTDKVTTKRIVEEQNFVFHATRAIPMPSNALTHVLNRFPNSEGSIINLTGSSYDLNISKDSVVAYLPYFGRSYVPSMDPNDAGTKFKSKDFSYDNIKKKKNWIITIEPKDIKEKQKMILSVSENGYATLSVNNNNRQPISYNGFISEPETEKK